jgi:NifU-like protein involved in Fe-S cluster formation
MAQFGSRVLDHFEHPRNAGIVAGHTHCYFEQDNPWLIRIRLTLRVEGERIREVKFQTQSCVTTTACASALTEMIRGKTLEHALSITPEQLSEYLGTVPPEKMHCCRLAVETLRRALREPHSCNAG